MGSISKRSELYEAAVVRTRFEAGESESLRTYVCESVRALGIAKVRAKARVS